MIPGYVFKNARRGLLNGSDDAPFHLLCLVCMFPFLTVKVEAIAGSRESAYLYLIGWHHICLNDLLQPHIHH